MMDSSNNSASEARTSNETPNYPDVLGAITGGVRANINVVQMATALRPRVARAGRPLEMLLLIQNAADLELEVTATLSLPQVDAKKQKNRFFSKFDRLIITLKPAEAGLVILPVSTMPDTAVGADYKIGMDVKISPKNNQRPNRIRLTTGGGKIDENMLAPEALNMMNELKSLLWTANQGTLRASVLESSFSLMSGTVGAIADLRPSWHSLWTLDNYQDNSYLLQRYGQILYKQVLPALTRARIYPVMQEYTGKRFAQVGYRLREEELDTISRLLTLMLEYANPQGKDMKYLVGEAYNLARYFDENGNLRKRTVIQRLPEWVISFLKVLQKEERVAQFPVKGIAHFCYDSLVRDAINHAFERIIAVLDFHVGTEEEQAQYVDHFFEALNGAKLTFDLLYLPLVMGGMALNDNVLLKGEKSQEVIMKMREMLQARFAEQNEHTRPVYDLANQLLEQTAAKYNFSEW